MVFLLAELATFILLLMIINLNIIQEYFDNILYTLF